MKMKRETTSREVITTKERAEVHIQREPEERD
jgi:hypothetical protein